MTENLDRIYLIEQPEDDLHAMEISCWDYNGVRHLTISSNFRAVNGCGNHSCGLSESMAQQIAYGLLAVLSKQFDRAVTETQLRVEEDRRLRDERIREQNRSRSDSVPTSPHHQPELDNL